MENVGDRTYCWYGYWHMDAPEQTGVCLATWERDRLGLLKPAGKGAMVVSAPVQITKGQANVYANASGPDGDSRLRVSLLDAAGRPLGGFSGAEAAVLTRSGLRISAAWQRARSLSAAQGKVRIQVEFAGPRGRLHAIYVGS